RLERDLADEAVLLGTVEKRPHVRGRHRVRYLQFLHLLSGSGCPGVGAPHAGLSAERRSTLRLRKRPARQGIPGFRPRSSESSLELDREYRVHAVPDDEIAPGPAVDPVPLVVAGEDDVVVAAAEQPVGARTADQDVAERPAREHVLAEPADQAIR